MVILVADTLERHAVVKSRGVQIIIIGKLSEEILSLLKLGHMVIL